MQKMLAAKTPWTCVFCRVCWTFRAPSCPDGLTCFIPVKDRNAAHGMRQYYANWSDMTLDRIAPEPIAFVPELAALCPPVACWPESQPALQGPLQARA
jgi:hypothetical protein